MRYLVVGNSRKATYYMAKSRIEWTDKTIRNYIEQGRGLGEGKEL